MIWWSILFVIIVPLIFVGVVKKAEATFACVNCGHSITIRHYADKQVTCKWCGKAHYTLHAWGSKVKNVEYSTMSQGDNKPARHGHIPGSDITVGVDITETEE